MKSIYPIYINDIQSLSSAGNSDAQIWKNYIDKKTQIRFNKNNIPTASLSPEINESLKEQFSDLPYRKLDRTVHFGIDLVRKFLKNNNFVPNEELAINLSSSRGATELFEKYHSDHLEGPLSTLASPTTTLGNLSSWVGQELGNHGFAMTHSITCSSALHAVLNAASWLGSGLAKRVICGGVEAPLTPFTIAQMKAMKIYSTKNNSPFSTPLIKNKSENDMVLGEGAGLMILSQEAKNASAKIMGIGYGMEMIKHPVGIHPEGEGLRKAMKMACKDIDMDSIDVIIMHAPGTLAGQKSELTAIESIWGDDKPYLFSTKFMTGHTFGASGAISMHLAVLMIEKQQVLDFPYPISLVNNKPKQVNRILVNAIGFGGNAISVLIERNFE